MPALDNEASAHDKTEYVGSDKLINQIYTDNNVILVRDGALINEINLGQDTAILSYAHVVGSDDSASLKHLVARSDVLETPSSPVVSKTFSLPAGVSAPILMAACIALAAIGILAFVAYKIRDAREKKRNAAIVVSEIPVTVMKVNEEILPSTHNTRVAASAKKQKSAAVVEESVKVKDGDNNETSSAT